MPFSPPGDLPDSGMEPASLASPALAGGFFTTSATGKPKWPATELLWPRETQVRSLGQEDPLEKEMATHFSIPVWEIPWTEETDGL